AASSFGKCITQVFSGGAVKDVQSPFGNPGSITPFSPHFQGNIRARYEWSGKGGIEWFVGGGVNYTSSYFNQPGTYPSGDVAGNG
ncbi:hypothetical protein ABTJ98_20785, partial [Acinetobacter baumannii]